MKKTMITVIALFALMATPALLTAAEATGWEKTKASFSQAADWTVSASKKAWSSTKQAVEDLNKKSSAKSKQSSNKWIRVKTDKGWRIVKKG